MKMMKKMGSIAMPESCVADMEKQKACADEAFTEAAGFSCQDVAVCFEA